MVRYLYEYICNKTYRMKFYDDSDNLIWYLASNPVLVI